MEPELLGTTWTCERIGTGRFQCPHCGRDRTVTLTRLHRWLAVLGRPVTRLGGAVDYRTCDGCGHVYPSVGATDPKAESGDVLAEDERAFLGVVSAMMLSDSVVRESEKEACREVVRRYTGRPIPSPEVDELLRSARARWGDPVERLARLRCLVPSAVKRRIVEAAYHVCTADGELHREEGRLLHRIGEVLDLGPREVRRALGAAKRRPVA